MLRKLSEKFFYFIYFSKIFKLSIILLKDNYKGESMRIEFEPQGVCCRMMSVEISEDNKILDAQFYGGCGGNLQGIGKLIRGMDVNEVISRLDGIDCGGKGTSCPDQLSRGLREYLRISQQKASQSTNL